MKTRIYEMTDPDVITTFFGDDPVFKALSEVAEDNATLIFEGDVDWMPGIDQTDTITLHSCAELFLHGGSPGEYVVLGRTVELPGNEMLAIVARVKFEKSSLAD